MPREAHRYRQCSISFVPIESAESVLAAAAAGVRQKPIGGIWIPF